MLPKDKNIKNFKTSFLLTGPVQNLEKIKQEFSEHGVLVESHTAIMAAYSCINETHSHNGIIRVCNMRAVTKYTVDILKNNYNRKCYNVVSQQKKILECLELVDMETLIPE